MRRAVAGIVFFKNKVLIGKKIIKEGHFLSGGWHMPGGYIRKKNNYKLGLVTNTSGVVLRRNELEFFGFYLRDLFDTVVVSSEVHTLKPEKEIYLLTLERLNSVPEKTIFIDDSSRYLEGTEKLGITTIKYTNLEQLLLDLKNLGIPTS